MTDIGPGGISGGFDMPRDSDVLGMQMFKGPFGNVLKVKDTGVYMQLIHIMH